MKPYSIINSHSTPDHSGDIVSRRIADELLLVPISRTAGEVGFIYTMNEVAAFVWENLDGKTSVHEICEMIVKEFEVDIETATNDIIELLGQLRDLGVVKGF